MSIQLTLSQLWPQELQWCEYHEWYNPQGYYENVEEWLECGCPLCMAEVVGICE